MVKEHINAVSESITNENATSKSEKPTSSTPSVVFRKDHRLLGAKIMTRKKGKNMFTKTTTVTCSSCHTPGHNSRTCHKNTTPPHAPSLPTPNLPTPIPNPHDLHMRKKLKKTPPDYATMLRMVQHTLNSDGDTPPTAENLTVWWELLKNQTGHIKIHPWEGKGNRSEELTLFVTNVVPSSFNGTIPEQVWDEFFDALSREENLAAASSQGMPQFVLKKLARSPWVEVRQEVARNKSTPPEAFLILREDVPSVRYHIAANTEAGEENFTYLADDAEVNVRKALALNGKVTEDLLHYMYKKETDMGAKKIIQAGLDHKKYLKNEKH